MRRILVTAISGDIGNGILKILQFQENILFGCDVNKIAVGMDLVSYFFQSKYAIDYGYIDDLLEKCIKYKITYVIPTNEREIEIIGKERKRFEEKNIKLVIQNENILDVCLDKYKTVQLLKKYGLTVPDTYLTVDEIRDINGNFICKPRKSNGSKGIYFFNVNEKGKKIIDSNSYVIQQYIDSMDEYTVGVFKCGCCINTIAFQRELKNGYSNLVKLVQDDSLEKISIQVANILDMNGYLNIQLKKSKGKYYIFEINPRISGTVRFRDMLGFSDVLWWLDMLDGKKIPEYHCSYSEAIGVRELNEKYLILK